MFCNVLKIIICIKIVQIKCGKGRKIGSSVHQGFLNRREFYPPASYFWLWACAGRGARFMEKYLNSQNKRLSNLALPCCLVMQIMKIVTPGLCWDQPKKMYSGFFHIKLLLMSALINVENPAMHVRLFFSELVIHKNWTFCQRLDCQ